MSVSEPIARRTTVRLGDHTTNELDERLRTEEPIAVLPTGSCEQHGPHLPLDTDTFLAESVAYETCRQTGDVLLPAVAIGYNEKELAFAGTVSVPAIPFFEGVVGIGRSLARSGWRRMVVVNGHGWNNDLVRAATHVLNEIDGFTVACCSYWTLCHPEIRALRESPTPGGMAHGCEFETSLMMHLRPGSVRMHAIVDEIKPSGIRHLHHDLLEKSPMFMPEPFGNLSTTGVIGSPSLATADKGRVWFQAAVGRLSEFLRDFRAKAPGPCGR